MLSQHVFPATGTHNGSCGTSTNLLDWELCYGIRFPKRCVSLPTLLHERCEDMANIAFVFLSHVDE